MSSVVKPFNTLVGDVLLPVDVEERDVDEKKRKYLVSRITGGFVLFTVISLLLLIHS